MSDDLREGTAWCLSEVDKFMSDFACEAVDFNACGFQQKERSRNLKPGRVGGS